jgi:DNA modification methylase
MSEAGTKESHEQSGYLLWVDPRNTIRCANVRMVREDSVRYLIRILTKDGYFANQPPTVYEPDPNVRACDMSETERASKLFRIRDGAHRLCALSKMMVDGKDPKFTKDFRVHVRVVPFNTDDLTRRADAVGDNFATENPITIRTSCDELWALMGVRSALLKRLVAYSIEWEAVATSGGYKTAGMPRASFPQMTDNVFDEFTRLMKKISPNKPRVLTLDEVAFNIGYVQACRYLEESIPPGMPPNAELNFIERHKRKAVYEGAATGASWKSVKWNTLCRLLPHAAIVDTPDESLQEGGNGLVRVEGQDTRLWDIICAVNNKGTALTTVPGSIDFKAMQTAFFTKEAGRRPFLVIFFLAALVRVAKNRGQPKGRSHAVSDLAYQVQTICWQYQRMAELLLKRETLATGDKARLNCLEELIWPYIVFNDTTFEVEALHSPTSSKGAALWATRRAKWTMATDLNITSNEHPELFKKWDELSADQQAIDKDRRALAHAVIEDTSKLPSETFKQAFAGTINTTPVGAKSEEVAVSRHVLNVGLGMEAHNGRLILGRFCSIRLGSRPRSAMREDDDNINPAAKRPRLDDEHEDESDEGQEAEEVEDAKAAVRSHLLEGMNVRMLKMSFEIFARSDESHELNGKVWLILTDPPYNTQRGMSGSDITHDKFSEEQMQAAADMFERLLAPGGQCFIFCAWSQISQWRAALANAGGGDSLRPDSTPELISKKPEHAHPKGGFRLARSNAAEFALHAYKKMPQVEGETPKQTTQKYSAGVAFGKKKISWRSENTMPPYARHLNNYVPPVGRGLLRLDISGEGEKPRILRTSQKSVPTLRDIIQLFAPNRDQLILDPFAGTMSTVIAAMAEGRAVVACEPEEVCYKMAVKRVNEYGYRRAARNFMTSIPEAQRECLRRRIPGHEAVDDLLEEEISMDEEGSVVDVGFDEKEGESDEQDVSDDGDG